MHHNYILGTAHDVTLCVPTAEFCTWWSTGSPDIAKDLPPWPSLPQFLPPYLAKSTFNAFLFSFIRDECKRSLIMSIESTFRKTDYCDESHTFPLNATYGFERNSWI